MPLNICALLVEAVTKFKHLLPLCGSGQRKTIEQIFAYSHCVKYWPLLGERQTCVCWGRPGILKLSSPDIRYNRRHSGRQRKGTSIHKGLHKSAMLYI